MGQSGYIDLDIKNVAEQGRIASRVYDWLYDHRCEWLMVVASVYISLRLFLEAPVTSQDFLLFFVVFQIVVYYLSVTSEKFDLSNKENYRPYSRTGVWCCLLLPLAIASSIKWFDARRHLSVLSFLCMVCIKQLFYLSTTLRVNLVANIILSIPSFLKVLETNTACLVLFIEVMILLSTCDLLMEYIPRLCHHSFTFGETCVIVQALLLPVCFINNVVPVHVFQTFGFIKSSSPVAVLIEPKLVPWSELDQFIMLITSFCVSMLVTLSCLKALELNVMFQYSSTIPFITAWCLLPVTQGATFWLISLCTDTHDKMLLMLYWILCIFLSLKVVSDYSDDHEKASSTVVRKIFHVIAIAIYLPGIMWFRDVLYVASAVVFLALLALECIRVLELPPLAAILDSRLNVFRDQQDSGRLILTHVYLLVGFSCPLWLGSHINDFEPSLKLFAGVISLGVGDTAASVGGTLFGRTKWRNSSKTVEGTLCAIISQLLACVVIVMLGVEYNDKASVVMAIVFTSFLEAFTTQIDNLVLPFYMYIFLSISKY